MSPGRREDDFSMQLLNENIINLSNQIQRMNEMLNEMSKTMATQNIRLINLEKHTVPCEFFVEHRELHKQRDIEDKVRREKSEERKWSVVLRIVASFISWVLAAGVGAFLAKWEIK